MPSSSLFSFGRLHPGILVAAVAAPRTPHIAARASHPAPSTSHLAPPQFGPRTPR